MRLIRNVLCCVLLCITAVQAQDTSYLSSMEDMPLMPGLTESLEDGMLFDQPEGRIVLAIARCGACGPAVPGYYRGILPALGWQEEQTEDLVFQRGSERLMIDVQAAEDGGDLVSFALVPGEAP